MTSELFSSGGAGRVGSGISIPEFSNFIDLNQIFKSCFNYLLNIICSAIEQNPQSS